MWVCTTHMKEVLPFLEAPHVSKASYQIECSLCDNRAVAKVYYTHHTYHFCKKQSIFSMARTSAEKQVN